MDLKKSSMVIENAECLACGADNLDTVLDLGQQPLANQLRTDVRDILDRYPLCLRVCYNCYHLQLSHRVNPEQIYREYLYQTGVSETARLYASWFASLVHEDNPWASSVLDIGCNDGTQLDHMKDRGFLTWGIDPAHNLVQNIKHRHTVVCDFFSEKIKFNRDFDIIIAQNVFAHNPDPVNFLRACGKIMHDRSRLYIQTSQSDMIQSLQYDTVYHEHINFFSALSMFKLCLRAGLYIEDIIITAIHNKSYVFVLTKQDSKQSRISNQINLEKSQYQPNLYSEFAGKIQQVTDNFMSRVDHYRSMGYRIVGYGAAAKAMTMLSWSGLKLDRIVDDNLNKQNLYTPILDLLIESPRVLGQIQEPCLIIALAWNYFDEIRERVAEIRTESRDVIFSYYPYLREQRV